MAVVAGGVAGDDSKTPRISLLIASVAFTKSRFYLNNGAVLGYRSVSAKTSQSGKAGSFFELKSKIFFAGKLHCLGVRRHMPSGRQM